MWSERSDLNASWVHSHLYLELSTCDQITQDMLGLGLGMLMPVVNRALDVISLLSTLLIIGKLDIAGITKDIVNCCKYVMLLIRSLLEKRCLNLNEI